jgi:hypothetical protein
VSAVAPALAVPVKSLFTMNSGAQVVATITSFDGNTYHVITADGAQTISPDDVKSVYALTAK